MLCQPGISGVASAGKRCSFPSGVPHSSRVSTPASLHNFVGREASFQVHASASTNQWTNASDIDVYSTDASGPHAAATSFNGVVAPGANRRFTNGSLYTSSDPPAAKSESRKSTTDASTASTSTSQTKISKEEFGRLPPEEQLKVLAEAKKRSREILQKIKQKQAALSPSQTPVHMSGPRLVDIRMFEQMVTSRDRMSEKLSDANKYVRILEDKLLAQNEEFSMVLDILTKMVLEVGNISRLSHNAAAAIRFSVDTGEPEEKSLQVSQRMAVLSKVLNEQLVAVENAIFREVPVYWHGVAASVKIMGDFDDWTQGLELNSETANDSVVATFEGSLYLRPGRYRCKFLVDSEWKLAPDWINEWDDNMQETNNVLVVE